MTKEVSPDADISNWKNTILNISIDPLSPRSD